MTPRIPGPKRRFTRLRVFTWATLIVCAAGSADGAEQIRFEVRETAGIRRFGYPVSWQFTLPQALPDTTSFRLSEGDRVVTAQFRPVHSDGNSDAWWLNLNVNLLPYESRDYVLEYGEGVQAPQESERGMRVERVEGELRIINAPYLTFAVPEDLRGLLRSLKTQSSEFLKPDSPGLVLRSGDAVYVLGAAGTDTSGLTSRITKEGPLSVALRFTWSQRLGDAASVETVVDLEFVNSKSWVCVDWSVADPSGVVSALGADLNFALEPSSRGKPTLVDFGPGLWSTPR